MTRKENNFRDIKESPVFSNLSTTSNSVKESRHQEVLLGLETPSRGVGGQHTTFTPVIEQAVARTKPQTVHAVLKGVVAMSAERHVEIQHVSFDEVLVISSGQGAGNQIHLVDTISQHVH